MAEILKNYRDVEYAQKRFPRSFTLEMLTFTVSALAALAMIWMLFSPQISIPAVVIAGVVFTLSIVIVIRLVMDPTRCAPISRKRCWWWPAACWVS